MTEEEKAAADFLKARGYCVFPRVHVRKDVPFTAEQLRARYEAGETPAEIASGLNVSSSKIRSMLQAVDTPFRKRGSRRGIMKSRHKFDWSVAADMRERGDTVRSIALFFGVTEDAIVNALKRQGRYAPGVAARQARQTAEADVRG